VATRPTRNQPPQVVSIVIPGGILSHMSVSHCSADQEPVSIQYGGEAGAADTAQCKNGHSWRRPWIVGADWVAR
jgi:hypothetical protein